MKEWITKNGYKIMQVLGGRSGAFIVVYQGKFILVDTGTKNELSKLVKTIDKLEEQSGDFVALVLTHTHWDHVENASKIKELYGVPIIVNIKEAENLANGSSPAPKGSLPVTRFMTNLFARKILSISRYRSVQPDIVLDGSTFRSLDSFGFKNISIMNTPGHTIGSQSLIIDDEIAIVGDTMFGIIKESVFPPFAEDGKLLMNSWGKLLQTECQIFLPSHGSFRKRELLAKGYARLLNK